MQQLSDLLAGAALASASVSGRTDVAVSGICTDSRQLVAGDVFVAIPGVTADGTQYVADALKKGAAALVLAEKTRSDVIATVPVIRVADMRAAVSALAATFYHEQPQHMVAVTGTDGKTSTADFVRQWASLCGARAASIGTLGLRSPVAALNDAFPPNNTSPEPVLLHKTLQALARENVSIVAMEASSHGLDQKRMDGVRLEAAAFTNLTRDHLDYHGTVEAYFAAKARLFDALLPEGATAVLCSEDSHTPALVRRCLARNIHCRLFGRDEVDYRILSVTPHNGGLDAELMLEGMRVPVRLPLYGAFQLYNILTAYGLLRAAGFSARDLVPHFEKLQGVRGRLERVAVHPSGAPMFVDYAHTPAALANILQTLRHHTEGKLHVVFGCGGDRDSGKRAEMGSAAASFADHVIVTDDNPRSEDPAAIRHAILQAAPGAMEIGDRREAIHVAVRQLAAGDVLVVAGKGHETYQIVGGKTYHFDDAEILREAGAQ